MSDTNGNERLDRVEATLAEVIEAQRAAFAKLQTFEEQRRYINEKIAEVVHMEMRSAAKIDAYREQAEEQSQKQAEKHENQMAEIRAENAETAKHLRHLTQVIRFLGDKSIEFDGKLRRAGEVFAEGESLAS